MTRWIQIVCGGVLLVPMMAPYVRGDSSGSKVASSNRALPVTLAPDTVCCECIYVPHSPDAWCALGACVLLNDVSECPEGYVEPEECPTGGGGSGQGLEQGSAVLAVAEALVGSDSMTVQEFESLLAATLDVAQACDSGLPADGRVAEMLIDALYRDWGYQELDETWQAFVVLGIGNVVLDPATTAEGLVVLESGLQQYCSDYAPEGPCSVDDVLGDVQLLLERYDWTPHPVLEPEAYYADVQPLPWPPWPPLCYRYCVCTPPPPTFTCSCWVVCP